MVILLVHTARGHTFYVFLSALTVVYHILSGVLVQGPLTRKRKFIVVRTCLQSVLRPYPNLNLRTDCYSDGDADARYYL